MIHGTIQTNRNWKRERFIMADEKKTSKIAENLAGMVTAENIQIVS